VIGVLAAALGVFGLRDLYASPVLPSKPPMYAVIKSPLHGGALLPQKAVQGVSVAAPAELVNCGEEPCLALTFDDGPSPAVTPQVLDILARHHVHATFFLIGRQVPGHEDIIKRMHDEGHEIGNHTWSHPDLTTLNPAQIEQQLAQTQAAITAAGVPAPSLFRPPYGAVNAVVKNHVPLTFAMWNDDTEDWKVKDPAKIVQEVESHAKPGRVILLHDIHQQTADALDPLLTDLQQHYQLVTFSELFNISPGQRGLFYGR
jgi:peptidoglycan-N-acetylglucosamine deacetylase